MYPTETILPFLTSASVTPLAASTVPVATG